MLWVAHSQLHPSCCNVLTKVWEKNITHYEQKIHTCLINGPSRHFFIYLGVCFQESHFMQIVLAWLQYITGQCCSLQHILYYLQVHTVHTNILPSSLATHLPLPSQSALCVHWFFCWNNETLWHWKVRFLLPQSCLRSVCYCCHCCASHNNTSNIWNTCWRLENTLCTPIIKFVKEVCKKRLMYESWITCNNMNTKICFKLYVCLSLILFLNKCW